MRAQVSFVWHYTTCDRVDRIRAEGFLRPAVAFVPDHEAPVVWFSSNQDFEITALKRGRGPDGKLKALTLEEMAQRSGGLARFGLPHRRPSLGRDCGLVQAFAGRTATRLSSLPGIADPSPCNGLVTSARFR